MNKTPHLPNTEAAVTQWLQQLQTKGLAKDTLAAYQRDITHLITRYPLPTPTSYEQNHLRFALGQLHGAGIQPRSLARMLSAWRNFFNWLSEHYQTGYNPAIGVHPPHGNYPDPKILSIEQTELLLNYPVDPHDPIAVRDQAIFELLYSSGLRLAEIMALDVQPISEPGYESHCWINLEDNEVEIQAKEQRQRTVPIGSKAMLAIKLWLAQRHHLLLSESKNASSANIDAFAALFLGSRGNRISPRVIQKQLQQRALAVGITKPVYPHRLRNSFANHLLESSNDVRGVQQLLGHAQISSTQSLSQLNPEQLLQFMQAHPKRKKAHEPDTES